MREQTTEQTRSWHYAISDEGQPMMTTRPPDAITARTDAAMIIDASATADAAIAEVTLIDANGVAHTATGTAKRHPTDHPDPELGANLAISRALADLAARFASSVRAAIDWRANRAEEEWPWAVDDSDWTDAVLAGAPDEAILQRAAKIQARQIDEKIAQGRREQARRAEGERWRPVREVTDALRSLGFSKAVRTQIATEIRQMVEEAEMGTDVDPASVDWLGRAGDLEATLRETSRSDLAEITEAMDQIDDLLGRPPLTAEHSAHGTVIVSRSEARAFDEAGITPADLAAAAEAAGRAERRES